MAGVFFTGVQGVRLRQKNGGWQVQIQPEYDNQAEDSRWSDVPGAWFKHRSTAEEQAPFVVPETHGF